MPAASASAADPDNTCLRVTLILVSMACFALPARLGGTPFPREPLLEKMDRPIEDQGALSGILRRTYCTANTLFRDAA
jgi:hypothetical protein